MAIEQHRHDISDRAWERIRPHSIDEKGTRGGNARNTRQFINGVFWILQAYILYAPYFPHLPCFSSLFSRR